GQRTRAQHELEPLGVAQLRFGVARAHRDLTVATRDATQDDRRAVRAAVQDDREAAIDVGTRQLLEHLPAGLRERERHVPLAHAALALIRLRRGLADQIAGDLGAALEEQRADADLLVLAEAVLAAAAVLDHVTD